MILSRPHQWVAMSVLYYQWLRVTSVKSHLGQSTSSSLWLVRTAWPNVFKIFSDEGPWWHAQIEIVISTDPGTNKYKKCNADYTSLGFSNSWAYCSRRLYFPHVMQMPAKLYRTLTQAIHQGCYQLDKSALDFPVKLTVFTRKKQIWLHMANPENDSNTIFQCI